MKTEFVAVLMAALAAPGFWDLLKSLFSALIGRRQVSTEEISEKLDSQGKKIDSLEQSFSLLQKEDETKEVQGARRRILRFNDELLRNIDHSKEYFDDILEDVEIYERHCSRHPDEFPNGKTVMAVKNIQRCYEVCQQKRSFLR